MSVVDAAAIMARCDELAAVSSTRGAIERVYLSPEHARVNAMAARWMEDAGMRTWQDAAGNQCGRYEGATPGSHPIHFTVEAAEGRRDVQVREASVFLVPR